MQIDYGQYSVAKYHNQLHELIQALNKDQDLANYLQYRKPGENDRAHIVVLQRLPLPRLDPRLPLLVPLLVQDELVVHAAVESDVDGELEAVEHFEQVEGDRGVVRD